MAESENSFGLRMFLLNINLHKKLERELKSQMSDIYPDLACFPPPAAAAFVHMERCSVSGSFDLTNLDVEIKK